MEVEPPAGRGIAATIGDIDAASDEADLRAGIEAARAAVAAELRAHTPTLTLAAAWSQVLRHSVATAVRLSPGDRHGQWTWFVSGSVGRGEAAPGSDVETLIVLNDGVDADRKIELMALAADVHAVLERCGVRGDANGVLASRGRFCRRLSSWTDGIDRWCAEPQADRGVVMTGLMVDSTGVRTQAGLGCADISGDALRSLTVSAAERHRAVRKAMLQDATAMRATFPSRLRVFATHSDTVDLKPAAIDPVVKIARWGALSAGSGALTTLERLDHTAAAGILDADDVSSLRDCFQWLLKLRWRHRADAWFAGQRLTDTISLSDLPPQERAMLRNVAREVAGIGRKLTFLASTSSFG